MEESVEGVIGSYVHYQVGYNRVRSQQFRPKRPPGAAVVSPWVGQIGLLLEAAKSDTFGSLL